MRGLAAAGRRRAGDGPADSGTHTSTSKRLPLTSTVVCRRTSGSGSVALVGGAAGAAGAATPDRSSVSSTHFVEWATSAKSSWRRIARSAGIVVATPSTVISSRARIVRAIAVGRSLPHTISLPMRLS